MTNWQELLYQALASPLGLLLQSSDPEKCRQRLYAARRAASDQALDLLQFRIVDHGEANLAITKGREAFRPEEAGI